MQVFAIQSAGLNNCKLHNNRVICNTKYAKTAGYQCNADMYQKSVSFKNKGIGAISGLCAGSLVGMGSVISLAYNGILNFDMLLLLGAGYLIGATAGFFTGHKIDKKLSKE